MFNPVLHNKPQDGQPQHVLLNSQNSQSQPKNEDETPKFERQQFYGFKSENSPPVIKELIRFEEELYKLSRNPLPCGVVG